MAFHDVSHSVPWTASPPTTSGPRLGRFPGPQGTCHRRRVVQGKMVQEDLSDNLGKSSESHGCSEYLRIFHITALTQKKGERHGKNTFPDTPICSMDPQIQWFFIISTKKKLHNFGTPPFFRHTKNIHQIGEKCPCLLMVKFPTCFSLNP